MLVFWAAINKGTKACTIMVCINCLTIWGDQKTQDHRSVGPVKPLSRCPGSKGPQAP